MWFGEGERPDPAVVLSTPALVIASGALAGRPVADAYPETIRREVESRCRAALAGQPSLFSCGQGREFHATTVRAPDGAVRFGLLLSGALARVRADHVTVAG